MKTNLAVRKISLALSLSAAVILSIFSLAPAGQAVSDKNDSAKQSLETFAKSRGIDLNVDLPVPQARAAELDVLPDLFRGGGHSGGNLNCTPSPVLTPGTGFSPKIDDAVRTTAINDLLAKIAACKPLPYSHDGVVNNNSEGHLPQAAVGYYKEYTLIVPGRKTGDGPVPVNIGGKTYMTGSMLSTRGPERIMIGGGQHIYYTPDHYATFVELTIVK